jgi:hypothetical protein
MPKAVLFSITFSVAVLSLWPAAARAVDSSTFVLNTTQDLYLVCSTAVNDPLRPVAINFCEGFLLGVVTYQDAIADANPRKRLICYPQGVTRDQGIQAFVSWAASHQQDRKFMADSALMGALRGLASKWPCK